MRRSEMTPSDRIHAVDRRLDELSARLRVLRGDYVAEALLWEQIDQLLDRRLAITGSTCSQRDVPAGSKAWIGGKALNWR